MTNTQHSTTRRTRLTFLLDLALVLFILGVLFFYLAVLSNFS